MGIRFLQAQDDVWSRRCHDTTDAGYGQDLNLHPSVWNPDLEVSSASDYEHDSVKIRSQDGGNHEEAPHSAIHSNAISPDSRDGSKKPGRAHDEA